MRKNGVFETQCSVSFRSALPDSPHKIISLKSQDFGNIILPDGRDSISSMRKHYIFFIFGCQLLPKNLAIVRKILALPD